MVDLKSLKIIIEGSGIDLKDYPINECTAREVELITSFGFYYAKCLENGKTLSGIDCKEIMMGAILAYVERYIDIRIKE